MKASQAQSIAICAISAIRRKLFSLLVATSVVVFNLPCAEGASASAARVTAKHAGKGQLPKDQNDFSFIAIGRQIIADRMTDDLRRGDQYELQRTFQLSIDKCDTVKCNQVISVAKSNPMIFDLTGCMAADGEAVLLTDLLVEGTFTLKNRQGKTFEEGTDYSIVANGTRLKLKPAGDAAKEDTLEAIYQCWLSRIDTIVLDRNGTLRVVKGSGYKSAPELPGNLEGLVPIANVLIVGGESEIDSDHIWKISRAKLRQSSVKPIRCRASLIPIRQKLESGERIKVGFVGDSVTGGSGARNRALAFPQLFAEKMRAEFPKGSIETTIFAMGGGKCADVISRLSEFLESQKPDIVFVEFVNDLTVEADSLRKTYAQLVSICKEHHAKLYLISPHYPIPFLAKARSWSSIQDNFYFELLKELTSGGDAELVDVSSRWKNLNDEGLRAEFLLLNRVNHPNNLGHHIYSTELLKCFGVDGTSRNERRTAAQRP